MVGIGKTKRGKGSKVMAIADAKGYPISVLATSATPHEVKLVLLTLEAGTTLAQPCRLIGDKAYDSDVLDQLSVEFDPNLHFPMLSDVVPYEDISGDEQWFEIDRVNFE